MKCHRNMENAVSVGTFGEKKCASTMQFVPRHTEIRHRRNIENLSACYSTAGLMNRTKSARCAARRARRWTGSERSNPCSMPFVRRGNYSFRVLSDITRLQSSDERETVQTVHRHRCRSHKFDDSIMRQFFAAHTGSMRSLTFPRTECFTIKNIWKKRWAHESSPYQHQAQVV